LRRLSNDDSSPAESFDPHDESQTLVKAVCNFEEHLSGKIFMQQQANPDGETHGKVHWSAHVTGLPAAQLIRFTYYDTNGSWPSLFEGIVT